MSEARKLILKMLEEKRITVDEANILLDTIQSKVRPHLLCVDSVEDLSRVLETIQDTSDYTIIFGRPYAQHRIFDIIKNESSTQTTASESNDENATEKHKGENILKQVGPGLDQIMGSVSNLIGSVTSQLGPTLEKKLESWRQQTSTARTTTHEAAETLSLEQILPLQPGCEKLIFHNPLGDISVSAGEDTQQIILRLDKKPSEHPPSAELVQKVRAVVQKEGSGIHLNLEGVELLRPEQLKVHAHLKIPSFLHLELSTLKDDISLSQLSHAQAACHLKTQSGDLHLEQVALKLIQLETSSGTIRVDQISESFQARSQSGDILLKGSVYQAHVQSQSGYLRMEIAVNQSLHAETQSSDIHLHLLGGAGRLDLQTNTGDIELIGSLQSETSLSSASGDLQGDIEVASTAAVSLNTNSGDIDVILRPESQCKLDIVSLHGDVTSRLEVDNLQTDEHSLKGCLGSGDGSLVIRSNTGDILIS